MATVSVIRCLDYDPARLSIAVREALLALPGMDALLARPGKVLLKPNLLSSNDPPERAVNTHPEFVRAAALFFIERGWKVWIGDSCGSLAPGSTRKAIQMTGLDRVAAEVGAQLVDFDRAPSVRREIPGYRIVRSVQTPAILAEMDLFVTLPKFKTHGLTLLTGAVKNQLGLVPGKGKKDIHLLAPTPRQMAQALLDIHSVVRPHLALMDAIVGMEGNGPAAGPPRQVGLVIAGDDCISLDAVAGAVMGCRPEEIETVRAGHERGLGIGRLEEIRVVGCPISEVQVSDFRKPPMNVRNVLFFFAPARLVRWAFDVAGGAYATVMDDRCVACGECVANCPAGAIEQTGKTVRIARRMCISCYCCSEVCRQRAIVMRRPLAGRIIYGLMRLVTGRWKREESR